MRSPLTRRKTQGTGRAQRRPVPDIAAGAMALGLVAGGLAGCGTVGTTDTAATHTLTWVSYLNGDDLRAACSKGGTDRYRLVFNADFNKHVRTFDVVGDTSTGGASVEARVLEANDLGRIDLNEATAVSQGPVERVQLTPRQFALFVLRLYESGAFEPAPAGGMRLPSNGVYWLINGCRRGNWFFNAYPYPTDRFADIRFDGQPGTDAPALPIPDGSPAASLERWLSAEKVR